ncbi:hypothetical protein AAFF_G00225860 [Aldrovandia affinis]|uniref:Uncharacterized protein n=1 Tax=Aldrovandia affinis TaxID=143900 RepID=A0AAD7TBI7_9TELE|nr:hypothetical protein AAFF_G00225860 [Aldrovandia affinis]
MLNGASHRGCVTLADRVPSHPVPAYSTAAEPKGNMTSARSHGGTAQRPGHALPASERPTFQSKHRPRYYEAWRYRVDTLQRALPRRVGVSRVLNTIAVLSRSGILHL